MVSHSRIGRKNNAQCMEMDKRHNNLSALAIDDYNIYDINKYLRIFTTCKRLLTYAHSMAAEYQKRGF